MTTAARIAAIEPILTAWATRMAELEAAEKQLRLSVGLDPDAPLLKAIDQLKTFATDTVAQAVGDQDDWCNWYWLENDLGKRAGSVQRPNCRLRRIRWPRDLARLIVEINNEHPVTAP